MKREEGVAWDFGRQSKKGGLDEWWGGRVWRCIGLRGLMFDAVRMICPMGRALLKGEFGLYDLLGGCAVGVGRCPGEPHLLPSALTEGGMGVGVARFSVGTLLTTAPVRLEPDFSVG